MANIQLQEESILPLLAHMKLNPSEFNILAYKIRKKKQPKTLSKQINKLVYRGSKTY